MKIVKAKEKENDFLLTLPALWCALGVFCAWFLWPTTNIFDGFVPSFGGKILCVYCYLPKRRKLGWLIETGAIFVSRLQMYLDLGKKTACDCICTRLRAALEGEILGCSHCIELLVRESIVKCRREKGEMISHNDPQYIFDRKSSTVRAFSLTMFLICIVSLTNFFCRCTEDAGATQTDSRLNKNVWPRAKSLNRLVFYW